MKILKYIKTQKYHTKKQNKCTHPPRSNNHVCYANLVIDFNPTNYRLSTTTKIHAAYLQQRSSNERAPILNQMLDNSVLHSRILQLYLCILHLRIWQYCNCICAFCIVAIVFAHCSSTWIILIPIVAVLTRIVLQLKSFFSIAAVMVEAHFGPLLGRYVIV